MITLEQYKACIEQATKNVDGVVWHVMGELEDGRELCLVFGYQAGYDKDASCYQVNIDGTLYTLCAKLAVNVDDLQCDFETDWYMPWSTDTGDVFDTCASVERGVEAEDVKTINEQAKELLEAFSDGNVEVL